LRQDLEILTRLHEIDEGLTKVGKVSNVKHGPLGSGPVYGYLRCNPCGKPDVIDDLLAREQVGDGAVGVAVVPHFLLETAVGLYELHVWMLLSLVRAMVRVHLDRYGDDHALVSVMARWKWTVDCLLGAGHLRPGDEG
jgi:hypothetical protein